MFMSLNEQCLRTLVEGIQDHAILMLDPQGRVASWTACAERVKGYRAEEILGESFARFYTPEDVERGHPEEVLRIAMEKDHFEEEGWRIRKDGSRFWANVMITVLRDEAGQVIGFSKLTRDITERRRAEEKLRESERQFCAVVESALDATVIVGEEGKIVFINAQTERLFGYRRDELVGQPVELLIPDRLRTHHVHHRSGYSRAPRARHIDSGLVLNGCRKDGSEFPVEVSLSPIKTANGTWVVSVVRDVAERRIVELELVAERKRAEEANQAKSAFLATMSHEIRTPMNAILGMSDLLWESDLDPEQRQFVGIFRRAGSKLLSLIDNILDLSKIEAGHFELEKQEFSLEDILDQVIELMGGKAQKKGIALLVRIAPGSGAEFIGDPGRLRQILLNLVGNALKFTEAGEITVTVQALECGGPGRLSFAVSDTGIGIPQDKLAVIFEDFTQADSSITRKYGGTGLGLGISRRLVEQMGGSLIATSSPGEGSTFQFDVVLEPVAPNGRRVRNGVEDFHGRRVLVVDNNCTNSLILRETLNSWGLECNSLGTATQALADLARTSNSHQPYSLMILDDCLPDMGCLESVAAIKKIEPAIPLIVLSSNTKSCDMRWRAPVGVAGYAVKPVKRADMLRMICEAMNAAKNAELAASTVDVLPKQQTNEDPPLSILIAEDSPDNRILVQAYLRGSPHTLTFVEDGQRAVEELTRRSFDLVLMDMQMPVMDGLTATRAVREFERERGRPGTPIVALTAHARQQDIEMSKEAGCDFHLSKPISKRKLLETIEKYVRHNPFSGPSPASILIRMPEDIKDLIPAYLFARREEIQEWTRLCATADFERLRLMSHNLKGSGTSYGFPDLTRLGGAMEKAATEADAYALQGLLAELGDYLNRVQLVS